MNSTCQKLLNWINETTKLTNPDKIHWCTGSKEEYESLISLMLDKKDLFKLNQETHPGSYLHRSDPQDVARTEHLTFVCTKDAKLAGPNNNWMSPEDGHEKVDALFKNSMQGRTMYVIPYCMGPLSSSYARCGVELTDSPYVVANMRLMTRMGEEALKRIEKENNFVKGLHSTGDLSPERRLIMHFPEEMTIKSIGSGYGGNALLGKKCHALRLASFQAREEGWLAEHMLILGLQNPEGEISYVAAAFPSACGKTNLAMLIPPEEYKGWKIWTVGDDISWMHQAEDGRLYAINPEAGFFGVAPGTSDKTNPNALKMLGRDAIFTNVAITDDNQPWWEGLEHGSPYKDWEGNDFKPGNGQKAAHPNSRFTVSMRQCPSYSPEAENPKGVPISAIIFGGRRSELVPLVYEAKDWTHGVFLGASMASETTAAATGKTGVLRRDPMAMKPFCGYNFASYWEHWLSFNKQEENLPRIFHVNWFRKDESGKFIWPGFGENMRVLEWILGRCQGKLEANETPIGFVPKLEDLNQKNLKMSEDLLKTLMQVKPKDWHNEITELGTYLDSFGEKLPQAIKEKQKAIIKELENS